jgi:hypothetical protein
VVSEHALGFIRECQRIVPCHLAGGAALAGTLLGHRISRDIDLFVHDGQAHRDLVAALSEISRRANARVALQRDAGGHVRARLELADQALELDVVHEALPDLAEADEVESVLVESERDLRASKVTCILSRSEPRDLVDLLFLERAGHRPEDDLEDALRKDGGIDPGILAWLLRSFPVEPLPIMLVPLDVDELRTYRDDLALRFKQIAGP